MKRFAPRVLLWLTALALMLAGAAVGEARLGAAAALLILIALGLYAPRGLRAAVGVTVLCAGIAFAFGGAALLIDLLPGLLAGLVGWLFARTLLPGRRPLIARAIAAIDGEDWLAQPAIARYGRRLTALWAVVQATLLLLGAASVLHARGLWPAAPVPAPRLFAAVILPGVVVAVFLIEFVLRRIWLPQAPRHELIAFLRKLAGAWPTLLE